MCGHEQKGGRGRGEDEGVVGRTFVERLRDVHGFRNRTPDENLSGFKSVGTFMPFPFSDRFRDSRFSNRKVFCLFGPIHRSFPRPLSNFTTSYVVHPGPTYPKTSTGPLGPETGSPSSPLRDSIVAYVCSLYYVDGDIS